ncbi:hypothetical protein BKA62DRAFT_704443 [Auriculariales sp. MPI-PUGE-AT-0066]|nr:hypothetical protein BKA62DRAFT_704443 [Auriculariales sp. MPI-PUGE-AT-0066]
MLSRVAPAASFSRMRCKRPRPSVRDSSFESSSEVLGSALCPTASIKRVSRGSGGGGGGGVIVTSPRQPVHAWRQWWRALIVPSSHASDNKIGRRVPPPPPPCRQLSKKRKNDAPVDACSQSMHRGASDISTPGSNGTARHHHTPTGRPRKFPTRTIWVRARAASPRSVVISVVVVAAVTTGVCVFDRSNLTHPTPSQANQPVSQRRVH